MHKDSVIIIGRGYVGTVAAAFYSNAGYSVEVLGSDTVDITNPESVRATIGTRNPILVVNTAALTNTAAAEKPENQSQTLAVNVTGPLILQTVLREKHIPWIHFSTGMLFDGSRPDSIGWQEEDLATPTNWYAWSKWWCDNALAPLSQLDNIIIARIHLPISSLPHARNFLNRLATFDKAVDIPSSLTILDDLFPALETLRSQQRFGLYHAVNAGTASALQIRRMLEARLDYPAATALTRDDLDAMGGAKQTFPILSSKKMRLAGAEMPDITNRLADIIERFSLA